MTDIQVNSLSYNLNSGNIYTGNRLYSALCIENAVVELVKTRKTKVLVLTLNDGNRIYYESAPKSLFGGYGSSGAAIDNLVRIIPELKKSAEHERVTKQAEEDEISRKRYGFLINDLHPYQELINGDVGACGERFRNLDTHTTSVFAMPCGIRGHRLLTVYHKNEETQAALCDAVREFFGDKIIQEGKLKKCDINRGERKMGDWAFVEDN